MCGGGGGGGGGGGTVPCQYKKMHIECSLPILADASLIFLYAIIFLCSADLNAIDENNSTPLMTAAENGNETAFQKMVECGDEKAVFDNFFQAAKESTNARVLQVRYIHMYISQ